MVTYFTFSHYWINFMSGGPSQLYLFGCQHAASLQSHQQLLPRIANERMIEKTREAKSIGKCIEGTTNNTQNLSKALGA